MKIETSTIWWIISFAISTMLMGICFMGLAVISNLNETANMYLTRGEWGVGLAIAGIIALCVQMILMLIIFEIASREDGK
jgi:hypothetical protein